MGAACAKTEETEVKSFENSSLNSAKICLKINYNYIDYLWLVFFIVIIFLMTIYCIFNCKKMLKKTIRQEIDAKIQNV